MIITNYGESSLNANDSPYFKVCQVNSIQSITDDNGLPFKIISKYSSIKITSTHLFNTETGISYEGEKLSGRKISIRYSITTRIKYLLLNSNSEVKFFTFTYPEHTTTILIPPKIDKLPIDLIIKQGSFEINYFIEDDSSYILENGDLFNSIIVLFYVNF